MIRWFLVAALAIAGLALDVSQADARPRGRRGVARGRRPAVVVVPRRAVVVRQRAVIVRQRRAAIIIGGGRAARVRGR